MSVTVDLSEEIAVRIDSVAHLIGRSRAWCVADAVEKYADLMERDWQIWDAQIEKDSAAGKFDLLVQNTLTSKSIPI